MAGWGNLKRTGEHHWAPPLLEVTICQNQSCDYNHDCMLRGVAHPEFWVLCIGIFTPNSAGGDSNF